MNKTAEKQTFHYGTWVFDIDKAQEIIAEAPRDTSLIDVDYWAGVYHVDLLRPDYEGKPWAPIFGPSQLHFNAEHAMTTDLDKPLIFAVFEIGDEKQALLIDGTHRLYRARVEGRDKLPAYYLTVEETILVQER